MRTVGRHRPASSPTGDTQAVCAYCGVRWLRSRLRRDEAGNLVCPDEGTGRDMVALARENSESARKRNRLPRERTIGGYEKPTFTGLVPLTDVLMNGVKAVRR